MGYPSNIFGSTFLDFNITKPEKAKPDRISIVEKNDRRPMD